MPSIAYALKWMSHHGVEDVGVNLFHLANKVQTALGDGSAFGVRIEYSLEEALLGTGGGLKRMQQFLSDDTFVVLNSDIIMDPPLEEVLRWHRDQNALATMVVRPSSRALDAGAIHVDASGVVRQIVDVRDGSESDSSGETPYLFCGMHILEPRFLDYIPPDIETCIVHYAYKKALQNGERIVAFVYDGLWHDIGTPRQLLDANHKVMQGDYTLRYADPLGGYAHTPAKDVASIVRIGSDVQLGKDVRILEPCLLGDKAKIGAEASIGPHVNLGSKTIIGKGARLQDTLVLDGASVAPQTELQGAIVHKKVVLHVDDDGRAETS